MSDPITTLEHCLGISTDDAEELLQLTFSVDQEVAIKAYGYPKDNLIPPPMQQRLADPAYVALLVELAADEQGLASHVLAALEAHLARITAAG
ncbi:MAG: hypothetical protein H0U74_08825 [Bradymonadaceae bacterium]|nr:hypothetical protein [Lujinxingiaceae bacterium]